MANGLLPFDHDTCQLHRQPAVTSDVRAYRRLAQTHKFRLANFSSIVPNTARLNFILEVAALFLVTGLQFLVLLDEVGDESFALSIGLTKRLEAF